MISLPPMNFADARQELTRRIMLAPEVKTERWQGKDVSKDPAAVTYELRNVNLEVPLHGIEDLEHWRKDIGPNLPWVDDHFLERVGGQPLNPGVQWEKWPWAASAAKFRKIYTGDMPVRFNHTYMERLWPKFARRTPEGMLPSKIGNNPRHYPALDPRPKFGLAHHYGDLQDLVELLVREPFTRQAYIPLFFPEDTGYGDGGRKVCTLGYQILVRLDHRGTPRAHIWYPLRSCDLIRHWPDDCYLAVRLLLWIIGRCREADDKFWQHVTPGTFAMHMTSLHIFANDMIKLRRDHAVVDKNGLQKKLAPGAIMDDEYPTYETSYGSSGKSNDHEAKYGSSDKSNDCEQDEGA